MVRRARAVKEKDDHNGKVLYSDLDTSEILADEMFSDRDAIPTEEAAIGRVMREQLRLCLGRLSEPERYLLRRRYWDELSQKELAKELGMTQQAVSYRERRTLEKLKNLLDI